MIKTPLAERIERWVDMGAKRIPLHPADYFVLERGNLLDKIEAKYNLEITCLGGENGLKKYKKEYISDKYLEE